MFVVFEAYFFILDSVINTFKSRSPKRLIILEPSFSSFSYIKPLMSALFFFWVIKGAKKPKGITLKQVSGNQSPYYPLPK